MNTQITKLCNGECKQKKPLIEYTIQSANIKTGRKYYCSKCKSCIAKKYTKVDVKKKTRKCVLETRPDLITTINTMLTEGHTMKHISQQIGIPRYTLYRCRKLGFI
jgi:hypothetical protein